MTLRPRGAGRLLRAPLVCVLACQVVVGGCSGASATAGAGDDTSPREQPAPSTYRPFVDTSPWNTPIPEDVALRPDSAALVQHLAGSSEWPSLSVSIHPWSVPVHWVDASTPLVDVHTPLSNEGEHLTLRWPVPVGAASAPEADGHLTLVDVARGRGYDFYQARLRGDGSWDCSLCATVDLQGSGVRPPKGGPSEWYASHGSRACGFPLLAGLITAAELRAGEIPHALVLAYPGLRQRWFVSPASTGHPANGVISESAGIPCGGRVQLDPALDLDALGLSPAGRTIARALQVYGAYVGDFSGSINVYADGSAAAREAYVGLLDSSATTSLDLSRLRVVEWGALTPDG
ncbi:MAG: hypothetical protein KC593_22965 [Myxococcales bacterium]|nr:hypothetical protein [Myxococcales bacterium]